MELTSCKIYHLFLFDISVPYRIIAETIYLYLVKSSWLNTSLVFVSLSDVINIEGAWRLFWRIPLPRLIYRNRNKLNKFNRCCCYLISSEECVRWWWWERGACPKIGGYTWRDYFSTVFPEPPLVLFTPHKYFRVQELKELILGYKSLYSWGYIFMNIDSYPKIYEFIGRLKLLVQTYNRGNELVIDGNLNLWLYCLSHSESHVLRALRSGGVTIWGVGRKTHPTMHIC